MKIKKIRQIRQKTSGKRKAIITKPRAKKVQPAPKPAPSNWLQKIRIAIDLAKLAKDLWPILQDIDLSHLHDLLNHVISLF